MSASASHLNTEDSDLQEYGLSAGAVAGDLVFAGAMALDGETMQRSTDAGTIAEETLICIRDLDETLKLGGASLQDLVKVNCYLSGDEFRTEFWSTWDAHFAAIDCSPVRLTQVVGIACGCRVELDGIAVRPGAKAA
jgi:2-iminobutanoate/2-iminopropanoate deaminase